MPQLQNLVLTDRKATPVAHTFTPRDVIGNVGTVTELNGSIAGSNLFSISLRRTSSGRHKARLQGVFPIVVNETINGVVVPKVARTSRVTLEFDFDDFSTEAERNDVVGMVADSLGTGKTLVNDVLVKLQGVY